MASAPGAEEVAPTLAAPLSASSDRPDLDLATIFRAHRHELTLRGLEAKVVERLVACRTAALGGHLYRCEGCRHELPVYNPCQDRHCPKCHGRKQAQWVEDREKDLLPVPYFHLVFTIPKELHAVLMANRKVGYGLLFRAASRTILDVAKSRLKATPGVLAVLHTWTQTLLFHPHIHCVVTGGGLSLDGKRWAHTGARFFMSVRRLGEVFRGKLMEGLNRALAKGELEFDVAQAKRHFARAARHRFGVYAKAPFAGPSAFLKYISRYVHRVAISDRRIVDYDGQRVTFEYRDRRQDNLLRRMTLPAAAFLWRFLSHLLPKGFVKIRGYGLLANRGKADRIERCRQLLGPMPDLHAEDGKSGEEDAVADPDADADHGRDACPKCSKRMVRVETLKPDPAAAGAAPTRSPP